MEATVNGIKINYISEGEGDVVIILHGWGASIEVYRSLIDALKPNMRVIALDMPGAGKTEEPQTPWCADDYTKLVVDFIKSLGIKKLSLIGHSFGGRVIIKIMSLKYRPFEVDKIVMIDSAGIRPKLGFKKKLRQSLYKLCKKLFSVPIVKWFYPDALDNLQSRFGSADYVSATPVMRATLVRVVNEDLTHLISNIDRPTLLIWGENDTSTPYRDAEIMNGLIDDSGIVKIEGAGHFSFLDNPRVVKSTLLSFFNA